MKRRVVRILLLQLCKQYLNLLQLTTFLPVTNQQDPCVAIGGMTLYDFFELLLCRLQLIEVVQGNGQVIAVAIIFRLKLQRFCQCKQGIFALPMVQQPQTQYVLQCRGFGVALQLLTQQLPSLVDLALLIERGNLRQSGLQIIRVQRERLFQGLHGWNLITAVQIKGSQLQLALTGRRLACEDMLILFNDLLQRAKVQPQFIGCQTQQGFRCTETRGLVSFIEQRPQQHTALTAGNQFDDGINRRLPDR